jgi:hypothetical protein
MSPERHVTYVSGRIRPQTVPRDAAAKPALVPRHLRKVTLSRRVGTDLPGRFSLASAGGPLSTQPRHWRNSDEVHKAEAPPVALVV